MFEMASQITLENFNSKWLTLFTQWNIFANKDKDLSYLIMKDAIIYSEQT
jgi:hypothetical protein